MSFSEDSINNLTISLPDIDISFENSFDISQQVGFVNRIMQNKRENGASFVQLEESAKLFNENPNGMFELPKQKYTLKRTCTKRFKSYSYVICGNCNELVIDGVCNDCNIKTEATENSTLVYIPLKQQIVYFIRKYYKEIMEYLESIQHGDDYYKDVYDGKIWQRYTTSGISRLSTTLNHDGGQCTKSTTKSLWPVQLYQNYLPPRLRYNRENIIVSTLFYGNQKLDVNNAIYLLSKEVAEIKQSKIAARIFNKFYKFVVEITLVSCDSPARADLMALTNPSGYNACPCCHHPGISTQGRNGMYVRYSSLGNEPKLRTDEETVEIAQAMLAGRNVPTSGFKAIPPMVAFEGFDLIKGFTIDYLHCVDLGVMKRLFDLWTGKVKTTTYRPLSPRNISILEERLNNLKPISEFSRLPKKASERSFWKGALYNELLLYYLYFGLNGILPNDELTNFRNLSTGVYILMQKKITDSDITRAERLLNSFVVKFEHIYGADAVTMNVHLIKHLAENVRTAGPLWVYALFAAESNMGKLIRSKSGKTSYLQQIAFAYCLERSEKPAQSTEAKILKKKIKNIEPNIQSTLINARISDYELYSCYKLNDSSELKSELEVASNRIDNCVQLTNGTLRSVMAFVKTNNSILVVVRRYEIIGNFDHFIQIESSNRFEIIPVSDISHKMIYLNFSTRQFATKHYLA